MSARGRVGRLLSRDRVGQGIVVGGNGNGVTDRPATSSSSTG